MEAEYRSAAITQQLTLWLIQVAASPDLIAAGLRIVRDELAHASSSHRVLVAAGGGPISPIGRESLALGTRSHEPLEHALARHGVEIFCLGETVAVPLFKALREKCAVPVARRTLDRVLRDEVRHRDFGWALLGHLLELPQRAALRAVVTSELPGMFARLQRSYAPVGAETVTTMPDVDRHWGLMPSARYRLILERTYERAYRPRFARLGIDAASAWQTAVAANTGARV